MTSQETSSAQMVWAPLPVAAGGTAYFQFGPLELWLQCVAGEYRCSTRRNPSEGFACRAGTVDAPPADIVPQRFVGAGGAGSVFPVPVMPSRSLVVHPDHPVHLLPGQSAEFFISVPLDVQLHVEGLVHHVLPAIPIAALSNTWFGDPTLGELCFSIASKAKRNLADVATRRWRAICPLTITNRRSEPIPAGGFLLQSRHLACHLGTRHLWATPVLIEATDNSTDLTATYAQEAPRHESILRTLSPAREPVQRSLLARGLLGLSFAHLF